MTKFLRLASCIFGALSLGALVSCSDNSIAIKPLTSSIDSSVAATSNPLPSVVPTSSSPETLVARTTGDLLTSDQKAKLKQLNVSIVVPTYLPAGFRLTKLESGREELRTRSYSYYSILYQGENDTCLDISLNTDSAMMTRRLEKTVMRSPISNEVTVLSGNIEEKPITIGDFQLPNGEKNHHYMLRTGAYMPSNQEGRNMRCNPVSSEEYAKVLQALEVLNLDETASINETQTTNAIASNANYSDSLLSAEQKAQLSQLGIDVFLPTYLPLGFKVSKFKTYKKRTSAIADYSFYTIQYLGADNTCIEAGSGYQSMWQKNPTKSQVDTKVGVVKISSGTHSRSGTLQYWGEVAQGANGQALITGGGSSENPCNPISFEEYNKVLQSLEVLNTK